MSGEYVEPMCSEESSCDRFILFNGKTEFEYADMYDLYKKQIAIIWTAEEVDLSGDMVHWNSSTEEEKHFIKMVLAFFASLDQIVMENVSVNFADEITIPQIRSHFAVQNFMESVHGETYANLILAYIKDPEEQRRILRSIQTVDIISKKADWVLKWMKPENVSLAERLVAFTCLEGVQFSGSFCAIFWLKKQGKFPGLCFANSFISRDEALHAEGSVAIYNHLKHKLPTRKVHEIFKDSVDMEIEFVKEALPVSLIGMNADSMEEYIKYIADFWLERLNYPKLYNAKSPFEWMQLIGLQNKSNFFERKVAEYSKANVMSDPNFQEFNIDVDF